MTTTIDISKKIKSVFINNTQYQLTQIKHSIQNPKVFHYTARLKNNDKGSIFLTLNKEKGLIEIQHNHSVVKYYSFQNYATLLDANKTKRYTCSRTQKTSTLSSILSNAKKITFSCLKFILFFSIINILITGILEFFNSNENTHFNLSITKFLSDQLTIWNEEVAHRLLIVFIFNRIQQWAFK